MKTNLLLLSGVFLLISCKKIRTCECTTTYTYLYKNNYQTQVMSGDNTAYSEKMSSKQAKAACEHEQNATQTNFTNAFTGTGHVPLKSGESISTSCDLK